MVNFNYYPAQIKVTLEVKGLHCWPNAMEVEPRVGFLSDIHRHTFKIIATKEVLHSNRDKEFIVFQNEIRTYLQNKYCQSPTDMNHHFGSMSCEMIATELVQVFGLKECEVWEDDEFAGICINQLMITTTKVNIAFVCGYPCSGKDTFIKSHLSHYDKVISVSKIAKQVAQERQQDGHLAQHAENAEEIARRLCSVIDNLILHDSSVGIVVDGIRQQSIYDSVKLACGTLRSNIGYWLDVPIPILKQRYQTRKRSSDNNESFETVFTLNDQTLGLGTFYQNIIKKNFVHINYHI